jgi:hypothetical protein
MKKHALLLALEESRDELLDVLDDLEDDEFFIPGVVDDWTIKDVLAHLTMWEAQLITLLWQARHGQKPTAIYFSGLSDDEINARWYQEARNRPLNLVLSDFHGARNQTIRRVEEFSEHDLNDPQRFSWSGGSSLWKWIFGSSVEHDREHTEQIKAWVAKRTS